MKDFNRGLSSRLKLNEEDMRELNVAYLILDFFIYIGCVSIVTFLFLGAA